MAALPRSAVDEILHDLASRQHGVVARRQLLAGGVPQHLVDYRVKRRRLIALRPGIYRVGPLVTPRAPEMSALLACGDGSLLSHRSSGEIWGLLAKRSDAPLIDVGLAGGAKESPSGIRVHRLRALLDDDVTIHEGLRTTTVARTLVDLAAYLDLRALEGVLARAERDHAAEYERLKRRLDRYSGWRGIRALRHILAAPLGPAFVRSEAEARCLHLIRKGELGTPETNAMLHGLEVDFLWRAERLVVEVDGFAHHSSFRAFKRDRQRDTTLAAAGYQVIRFTWSQLRDDPYLVVGRIGMALGSRRAR